MTVQTSNIPPACYVFQTIPTGFALYKSIESLRESGKPKVKGNLHKHGLFKYAPYSLRLLDWTTYSTTGPLACTNLLDPPKVSLSAIWAWTGNKTRR
jgi:hypothetical protein